MQNLKETVRGIQQAKWPFYVYILFKPDGTPFYVGKGKVKKKDQRITWHEQEARRGKGWKSQPYFNALKSNTINKIWCEGGEVRYLVDSFHCCEIGCYDREKELIAQIGRKIKDEGPLTNLTEGGEKDLGAVTEEAKAKISASLKKYYEEHPEAIEAMSERGTAQFADPERRKQAREDSLRLETGKKLMAWRRADSENEAKRAEAHGKAMKQWYKDNPEKTQEIIAKRNEKKRTVESRAQLSNTIKQKIKDNPEWDKARRAKTHEISRQKAVARQEFLLLLRDYLVLIDKLEKRRTDNVGYNTIGKWKKLGKIPEWLVIPKGHGTVGQWQELSRQIKEKQNGR